MYKYKVFIEKVKCRDTESLHSSDKLVIAGAVVTHEETKGYVLPLIRINTDEERFLNALIFDGISQNPSISLALQATDIDENDGWYENKDNIIQMSSEIGTAAATYLSANPEAGARTGDGIKKVLPIIGSVITFFTKKDKNDSLGQFNATIGFDNILYGTNQTKPLLINFNEHDDYIPAWPFGRVYVDYNDFTYDFSLRIECEKTLGQNGSIIYQKWRELGSENSFLGQPVTDEQICPDNNGHFVHFQGGSIYWTPQTGAFEVHGDIRSKWEAMNWERGHLGYPLTDETTTPDEIGRFNHFQGGSIYWTPETGASEVHGAIRNKWESLGWETGYLGYPLTDETMTPDGIGRFNHFQGGSIYWTMQTGAFAVQGGIRAKWASLRWERGSLGYPISDEFTDVDGKTRVSKFQGGKITWTSEGGSVAHIDALERFNQGGIFHNIPHLENIHPV